MPLKNGPFVEERHLFPIAIRGRNQVTLLVSVGFFFEISGVSELANRHPRLGALLLTLKPAARYREMRP